MELIPSALKSKAVFVVGIALSLTLILAAGTDAPTPKSLAEIETAYTEWNDAHDAIQTIDSGLTKTFAGKDRKAWEDIFRDKTKELTSGLAELSTAKMSPADTRAANLMRKAVEAAQSAGSTRPPAHCKDAQRSDLSYDALHDALYACFSEIGSSIQFEGKTLDRTDAMGKLGEIDDPQHRKTLFLAINPLWTAINGNNQPDSPYRRLIAIAAGKGVKKSKEIEEAARTLGVQPADVEKWLVQILETWSQVIGDRKVEPWDLYYQNDALDRALAVKRESMQAVNDRYYRDLGADLAKLGVIYDLDPHPGKAPLAYCEFATHGRETNGVWHASIPRVSASYSEGSLGSLNEFVHENGHAVRIAAIHTRPAFMDWGDSLFEEAFADVTSWNTYEPAWQKKYLGTSAPEDVSLRSLYSGVMMDVAWSLFEVRMLHNPTADPNAVWTDITSHYLHVIPHPEFSWWALRVQLVDAPGYMINYGLGAVLTADLREHTTKTLGSFTTGNPQWYAWTSERLLRYGAEEETSVQLQKFLGRPVSPEALLTDLRRAAVPTRTSKP